MASGGGNRSSNREMEEENRDQRATASALAVGAAAGVAALAAWGISKWLGISEPESAHKAKMMKAPGADYYMPRDDFEKNPSAYFRNLRNNK